MKVYATQDYGSWRIDMVNRESAHRQRIKRLRQHGDYRVGTDTDRKEIDNEIEKHEQALALINEVKKLLAQKSEGWKLAVDSVRAKYRKVVSEYESKTTPFTAV